MKTYTKSLMAGALMALVALPTISGAAEFKLTASSSHPPKIPWIKTIKDHVVPQAAKRAKTLGHTIKWTEAYGGVLYNFKNTLEGIQDGLGDIGWVGTLWEPNKLPLQNLTFAIPFVTGNVKLIAGIENDLHRTIPAMSQAFLKHNQVYLGPHAIDDFVLISTTPINSVADLKGKKFYAPGASSAWLKGTGAIGVNGGLTVMYNGIKTGVAQGAILPITGILPFKLHEVAPYVIQAGLGGGMTGALTMNKDTYDKLPPEMQKMFQALGKEYGVIVSKRVSGFASVALNKMLPKAGAKVSSLPLEERKKWAVGLPNLAKDWVGRMKARGLPGEEVLKKYMAAVRAAGEKPLRDWDK